MMSEEAYPEAAAILRDAGWKPHDPWGVYTRGTLVMGFSPDGQHFDVKNWGADVHGEDYPDDPVEAAQWLVRLRANPLSTEATLEAPVWAIEETFDPQPEQVETPGHEASAADDSASSGMGAPEAAPSDAEPASDVDGERSFEGGEAGEGFGDGSGEQVASVEEAATFSEAIDADFEAIEELGAEDDLLSDTDFDTLAIEGADVAPEPPQQDGPIAYGASTIDGLIREKLGRVSQIARELKAIQQEGWTLEEFAYLQNLIVRMDRGEAPDDQASRERFLAIAAKSQAMSRIDSVRDRKEGELEEIGQRRDFDAAVYYEPGEGWPE